MSETESDDSSERHLRLKRLRVERRPRLGRPSKKQKVSSPTGAPEDQVPPPEEADPEDEESESEDAINGGRFSRHDSTSYGDIGRGKAKVVLFETVDMAATRQLLARSDLNISYRRLLLAVYESTNRAGGYPVQYRFGSGRSSGRLYAKTGFQLCPAAGRRLALPDHVKEFDIVNSVPVILLAVAKVTGVEASLYAPLEKYVEDRDTSLSAVAAVLETDIDGAKQAYLRITHGSTVVHKGDGTKINLTQSSCLPELYAYSQSVTACAQKLSESYPYLWEWCKHKTDVEPTPCGNRLVGLHGRFVHFLCTHFEGQILQHAAKFFSQRGCLVITLIHDALLVEDPADVLQDPATQRELQQYISRQRLEVPTQGGTNCAVATRIKAPLVQWKMERMIAKDGDLEVMSGESAQGPPGARTGFQNTRVYKSAEDLVPYMYEGGQRYGLQDVSFENGVRVNLLNAPMGSGKTHIAVKRVVECLQENRDARVLWITGRSTQAQACGLPLTKALQKAGIMTPVTQYNKSEQFELYECQILIVQYESLRRLRRKNEKDALAELWAYDILIVDEFRLIMDQRVSVMTNRLCLRENNSVFEEVCRSTPRVLVLDADLTTSPACYDFWIGSERGAGVSTQAECSFHDVTFIEPRLRRGVYIVPTERDFIERLATNLQEEKLTMVAFRCQSACQSVYDELSGEFPEWAPPRPNKFQDRDATKPEDAKGGTGRVPAGWNRGAKVILLTGETHPDDVAAIMMDLDGFISQNGCVLFLYTSTLCVAADLKLRACNVMLHCGSKRKLSRGGPNARILWQMVLRARNVEDQTVYTYLGDDDEAPGRVSGTVGDNEWANRWQRCVVFKSRLREYILKRSIVLPKKSDKIGRHTLPSIRQFVQASDGWRDVVDPTSGRRYRVEIESCLLACLIANQTETEWNRGNGIRDRLLEGHNLVVSDPCDANVLAEKRAELTGVQSGPVSKVVNPGEDKDKDATSLTPEEQRLAQGLRSLPWTDGVLCEAWCDRRLGELNKSGPRIRLGSGERGEKEVLSVLKEFPGLLVQFVDRKHVPTDEELLELYKGAKKALPMLRNLHYVCSGAEEANSKDQETVYGPKRNPLPVTVEHKMSLFGWFEFVAQLFGYKTMQEFLDDDREWTSDDAREKGEELTRALRGLMLAGYKERRRGKKGTLAKPAKTGKAAHRQAVAAFKSLLGLIGYELKNGERDRSGRGVAGKSDFVMSYSLGMRRDARCLQSAYKYSLGDKESALSLEAFAACEKMWELEDAEKERNHEGPGDDWVTEKRKLIENGKAERVTGDKDV